MIMNFIMLPLFFLSGALFPLRNTPTWMRIISMIDPITYGVDPLRAVTLQNTASPAALENLTRHTVGFNVLIMAGIFIVFIIPAAWLFSRRE